MIYPNGLSGSWAGPSYHSPISSTVAEDIQYVSDVLADAASLFCVDASKTFAVGMSNGGGFVGTLACDPLGSTLFTAFAAHSGAFYTDLGDGCTPSRKVVPMLEIHGTDDRTVRYEGGKGDGGMLPDVGEWVGRWAERNACEGKKEESMVDGSVTRVSWTCGGVEGVVQHWRVGGLGTWFPSSEDLWGW
jgi:poly(3-hydroxybutyrate) depolymerase